MSRLDWKRGAFNPDSETERIFAGMEGWREVHGDWIFYYRFNPNASVMDDVYDEAAGIGRVYNGPIRVPAIHVIHIQGPNEYGDMGFYHNDELTATVSFDQMSGTGLTYADVTAGQYLKDRLLYNDQIYRITQISSRGKIQQRSVIVDITATQMQPDELVDDGQFRQWSA